MGVQMDTVDKEYYEENKDKISVKAKEYYKKNKVKLKIGMKKYNIKNREKIRVRKNKYNEEHKEERIIRKKVYYKNNKDRIVKINKKWRGENKEKVKAYRKKYQEENKDKITLRRKKYCEENKDKIKKYYKENRNIILKQYKELRERKKLKKNNKCIVCGEPALDSYCSDECKKIVMKEGGYSIWIAKNQYPIEWTEELRKSIRDRDNNRCMRCGRPREELKHSLSVHHIDADKNNCSLNNLISLCDGIKGSCHSLTRGKEYLFVKGFCSMLSRAYGYEYNDGGEDVE